MKKIIVVSTLLFFFFGIQLSMAQVTEECKKKCGSEVVCEKGDKDCKAVCCAKKDSETKAEKTKEKDDDGVALAPKEITIKNSELSASLAGNPTATNIAQKQDCCEEVKPCCMQTAACCTQEK